MRPKTALVTGGTSGIGMQICVEFLQRGVKVIMVGRNFERAKNVQEFRDNQDKLLTFLKADLTKDTDLHNLLNTVKKENQGLDFLIHSAGVFYSGEVGDSPVSYLDQMYKVNTRAPYFLTSGLLELLKRSTGRIVFINSTAGLNSWKNIGQYAATKHALSALAGSFQAELEPYGIKVTSVFPAATDTPMQRAIHESENRKYDPENLVSAGEVAEIIVDMLHRSSKTVVSEIVIRSIRNKKEGNE